MRDSQDTVLDQMERLSDVPIVLRAELDRTTVTVGDVLDLEVGSVLRLARPAGENVDVYAENVLIGWGEILMVDGALMVRLADLRDAQAPPGREQEEQELEPAMVEER